MSNQWPRGLRLISYVAKSLPPRLVPQKIQENCLYFKLPIRNLKHSSKIWRISTFYRWKLDASLKNVTQATHLAPLRLHELSRVLLHRDEIVIAFCFSCDLARKQLDNSNRKVSLFPNFVIRAQYSFIFFGTFFRRYSSMKCQNWLAQQTFVATCSKSTTLHIFLASL